jgi:hypothetical protein
MIKALFDFKAKAPVAVRPEEVDPKIYGDHRSVVLEKGIRYWSFEDETGRNLFLMHHKDQGAEMV